MRVEKCAILELFCKVQVRHTTIRFLISHPPTPPPIITPIIHLVKYLKAMRTHGITLDTKDNKSLKFTPMPTFVVTGIALPSATIQALPSLGPATPSYTPDAPSSGTAILKHRLRCSWCRQSTSLCHSRCVVQSPWFNFWGK